MWACSLGWDSVRLVLWLWSSLDLRLWKLDGGASRSH